MKTKKTTVNLTERNWKKIQDIVANTHRLQSDIINQAISEVPIIILGDQKSLAESFFELRKLAATHNYHEYREEAEYICQSLSSLMEKIEELMPSEEE